MKKLLSISILLILLGGACKADKVHIKDVSGFYEISIQDPFIRYRCHLNRENDSLYSFCITSGFNINDPCSINSSSYFIFSTEKGKAHGRIVSKNNCGEPLIDSFSVDIEYKNGHDVMRFIGQTHGYCCENGGSLGQPEPNQYNPCSRFVEFWKLY